MNSLERKMVEVLKDLRDNHGVNGIKAEFESEGTRLEEALRLKDVVTKAGLDLTIKIGGCEAMVDMYECRKLGAQRIVSPMIESDFALKKFLSAVELVFSEEELEEVDIAINIETITGFRNFTAMLSLAEISRLNGVVMGRVDMTGSMGLTRADIDSDSILDMTHTLFAQSKRLGLENAVGGGVSANSIPFFQALTDDNLLDRFETRKVIFACPDALNSNPEEGLRKAVGFELLWLKNKHNYYRSISLEDAERLDMLEARYKTLTEKAECR